MEGAMNPQPDPQLPQDLQQLMQELQLTQHRLAHAEAALAHATIANAEAGLQKAKLREPSPFNAKKKNDVDRFLQQMQTYLTVCNVPQDKWAYIASTYFDGDVVVWWETHQIATQHRSYTWAEFCNVMRTQFRPLNYKEEARRRLTSMYQGNWTVYEYAQRFYKEVNLLGNMADDDQLYHFRKGLNPDITRAMLNSDLHTLEELVQEASRVETRLKELAAMRRSFPAALTRADGPTPMDIGALRSYPKPRPRTYKAALNVADATAADYVPGAPAELNSIANSIATPKLKKLDDAERARCRRDGLCFRCRKPGHTSAACKDNTRPSGNPVPRSTNFKRQ